MCNKLLYFILASILMCSVHCDNPEVQIPQGRLRGADRTNRDGGSYYSFQNIPFAKPPIGDLRFKAPQPAEDWNDTRDATSDVTPCVQEGNAMGQEDCLYLNVYTPGLPEHNVTQLPVMVFIYGGAFTSGSASEFMYGGQLLLTKDVILVIPNYRVGIFGFFSLDEPNLGVTGNAGLKDQALALKWVQDNIKYFGGDPNNVLLFGESAGSISINFHLLSPMSKGLFHKAISQSGEALTGIIDPVTRNNGEVIAKVLGIETDNWENMLVSLQEVPAGVLSLAELPLNPTYRLFSGPIVEISSQEGTFIEKEPLDIIRSGNYNQVPFIIGVNDAEGLLFEMLSRQESGESVLLTDFTEFVPRDIGVEDGSAEQIAISEQIRTFYYGDTEPSRENITGAVNLLTDYGFAFPSYRMVSEYLRTAENSIHFYYFTAITELNFLKILDASVAAYPGAAHADELGYLFYMMFFTPTNIEEGSVEDLGIKNMVNLWTNFAIYGNPTPDNSSDLKWLPVEANQFNYLHIGTKETFMDVDIIPERIQFWSNLYEQYSSKK